MDDSSIARIVGALFSPVRTFEAIGQRPTWLLALVLLVGIGVLGGYLAADKLDWEGVARQQIEQSGRQLSEDQIERQIDLIESVGPKGMLVGPLVGAPVVYLLIALLFWVLLKLLGADFSFKASFATALHGLMPTAVSGLLSMPVVLSRDELSSEVTRTGGVLKSNLAAFAPEEAGGAILALLSSIDLFSIWSLTLLTIGYAVVARVSRGKAAAAVVGLWAVYVALKVGMAAITG